MSGFSQAEMTDSALCARVRHLTRSGPTAVLLGTCGLGTVEREANLNPVGCVPVAAHHPTGSPAEVAAFWATFLGDQQPTLLFVFSLNRLGV